MRSKTESAIVGSPITADQGSTGTLRSGQATAGLVWRPSPQTYEFVNAQGDFRISATVTAPAGAGPLQT